MSLIPVYSEFLAGIIGEQIDPLGNNQGIRPRPNESISEHWARCIQLYTDVLPIELSELVIRYLPEFFWSVLPADYLTGRIKTHPVPPSEVDNAIKTALLGVWPEGFSAFHDYFSKLTLIPYQYPGDLTEQPHQVAMGEGEGSSVSDEGPAINRFKELALKQREVVEVSFGLEGQMNLIISLKDRVIQASSTGPELSELTIGIFIQHHRVCQIFSNFQENENTYKSAPLNTRVFNTWAEVGAMNSMGMHILTSSPPPRQRLVQGEPEIHFSHLSAPPLSPSSPQKAEQKGCLDSFLSMIAYLWKSLWEGIRNCLSTFFIVFNF